MSIGIVSSDPTIQLAALMLENDAREDEIDRDRMEAARRAEESAAARQVEALHDAADAVARGAWLQGGVTVLGGGISMVGIATTPLEAPPPGTESEELRDAKLLQSLGATTSSLAGAAGALAGEVPRLHAEARAQRAAQDVTSAGHAMEDARSHAERMDRHSDAVLDLLEKVLDQEAQGNSAVLGNF
jgi:hypothetical protein